MTMPAPGGGSNNRQAQVTVTANVDPFTKSMGAASKAATAFGSALKAVDQAIFSVGKKLGGVAMGGGALALFGDIKDVQKAAQFQTQLVTLGVQSGVTGKQLTAMGTSIQGLGKTIPSSGAELMRLATQLASVGVNGTKQLTALTASAERLSAATNTAPGQLMTGLVQIGNSLGTSLENVSRYGDVLTSLQQNMGASATDTLQFASGISAVASKAGVGQASILGFAGAFQKLGIDSTTGAQAFNTIMNDMSDSVARGTTRMQLYANTLGMTSDGFKQMFQDNPAQAFTKFVDSIAAQGQRGGQTLDQFGLDGSRMIKVFASLTSGAANLQGALTQANSAYAQGDATAKASAAAYDTFDNKLQLMENSFERLKEVIGAGFLPILGHAVAAIGSLGNGVANIATYVNQIHFPVIGDWASRWAGIAAGVGLAAGAFALMAANITKLLAVWRIMSGVLGGSALKGIRDGMMRGTLGGRRTSVSNQMNMAGGSMSYARGMDPMENASRTQLAMYSGGYRLASGARRTGPLVDPEANRIGRAGLVRGGVGAIAGFPLARTRQILRSAKDTAMHPFNAANRDPRATDPYSAYGGYQALVRGGTNVREGLVNHLTREGAADWEKNLGAQVQRGFGPVEDSAARLRYDRTRVGADTWNQAYGQQTSINSQLNREQKIRLLQATDAAQIATGQKKGEAYDFTKSSNKELDKHLTHQAAWTADNAHAAALKDFDSRLGDKETAQLANPFQKLATKIKEITKSIATDSGAELKAVMTGLQSFFEKALMAVGRTAKMMYAELVRLKTLANGGTTAQAAAAAAAVAPPPVVRLNTPGTPGGPPGPVTTTVNGTTIPATGAGSQPSTWIPGTHRGVNPEAHANSAVSDPRGNRLNGPALIQPGPLQPGLGQRMVTRIDDTLGKPVARGTVDAFTKGLEGARKASMAFGSDLFSLTRRIASPQMAMGFMMYGGLVVAALAKLNSALDQTAKDSQYAGNEIQKSLGRQWLSPTQLAQQSAQSNANKADQDPWGATERKDAKGSQFAQDHASTLQEINTFGKSVEGVTAVIQQQINGLVQQNSGAAADEAQKQQIRELLMNSGLDSQTQQATYGKLDFSGTQNAGLYSLGMNKLQSEGTNVLGFGPSDLNKVLTAQSVTDLKTNNNAAGAAYMLLQSDKGLSSGGLNSSVGNAEFQNLANGIIKQANNGTQDTDAAHISPDNKQSVLGVNFMGGLDRDHGTANSLNDFLDQLKNGNTGAQALGQQLLSSFRDAGLAVDNLGHVSGDTSKALEILQGKAGNINGQDLQLAAKQSDIGNSRIGQLYKSLTGNPDGDVESLTSNTSALDYSAKIHAINQELINDVKRSGDVSKDNPLFTGKADVGITSPAYADGLKNAIIQIQKLKDTIGTPTDANWIALDALQQEDSSKLSGVSSALQSPAQQIQNQTDILNAMTSGGVNANNNAQVTASVTANEQLYDANLGTLKQAYMQVHDTHIQMAREAADFQHQMTNSQRDYNRQTAEAWYQYNTQEKEALYQQQWAADQRLYSFNEEIRSQKYSLANAFGNAGSMVQAQYTQGAQASLTGMSSQVKMLQDSQDSMSKLSTMGLSGDAIRVLKLDDPANVAQAKRYIQDFANNPELIKSFNDSIGARLNITNAIASNPNNSSFAELKRQFDKTAADAGTEFQHSQQLSSEAFSHSMDQAAQSFQISMGDFQYNYNLQMSRTVDDMSRMNEYIAMSSDDLIKWAESSGIPGYSSIASAMQSQANAMANANAQIAIYANNQIQATKDASSGNISPQGAATHADGSPVTAAERNELYSGLPTTSTHTTTPGYVTPSSLPSGLDYSHIPTNLGGLSQLNLSGLSGGTAASSGGFAAAFNGMFANVNKLAAEAALPKGYSGTSSLTTVASSGDSQGIMSPDAVAAWKAAQDQAKNYSSTVEIASDKITAFKKSTSDSSSTTKDQTDKQHDAEKAILAAVDAAGKKAAADNIGKTPTEQATAVVAAQRDTFNDLTGQIGGVPGALQNLGKHLNSAQDPITTTTQVTGDMTQAINDIPKDPKVKFTAETKDANGAIDGMKSSIGGAIHFLIDTVLNNGLIAAWDWIVDKLGLPSGLHVDAIKMPKGFSGGGYTGDGRRMDPAGIVHAGEFVLDQEKTRKHRPLLERIHRGDDAGLPGYAGGGAVKGVTWQQLDAIRANLFPGSVLTSAYRPGSADYHGRGEAIDIGVNGNLQSGLMPIAARLASLYPQSTELIHNPNGSIKNGQVVPSSFWGASTWAQHANHVHWAMTPDALASGAQGDKAQNSTMSLTDALLHPLDYLRSVIGSGSATAAAGPMGNMLGGIPGKLIDGIGTKISDWIGSSVGSLLEGAMSTASSIFGQDTRAKVNTVAKAFGWGDGTEWNSIDKIVSTESSWNPKAKNPKSSAYGLFQLIDANWGRFTKGNDPIQQAGAGLTYIKGRYGDPEKAWNFHKAKGWYANGGIFDAAQTIGVGESGPEAVLPLNSHGASFMAQTLKATVGLMGGDPQLAQTLKRGRTSHYASPARSEMHVHHTDASTNFHGDITVVASDPNEMARKLAAKQRLQALTRPIR